MCACASFVLAGWQVDEGEDVVLDEAGETQEDGVEEETDETQALVQRPLVQVDSQHLHRQTGASGPGGKQVSSPIGTSESGHHILTVRNTDASRSPTEKISPLLFSLICKTIMCEAAVPSHHNEEK